MRFLRARAGAGREALPRAKAIKTCAFSTSTVADWRDVIEQPIADDLDVSGWELRKALRLLRKSYPPLLEWLKSPVVYRHDPVFVAEFGAPATEFDSPRRCFAHYLHMAYGNWRDYLRGREEAEAPKCSCNHFFLYVLSHSKNCALMDESNQKAQKSGLKIAAVLTVTLLIAVGAYLLWKEYTGGKKDLTEKPKREGLPSSLETSVSRIAIFAEVPLTELTPLIEQRVPPSYSDSGNGPDAGSFKIPPFGPTITIGTKYDFAVNRGPISASAIDRNTIRFSVPISFSGHGGFRGTGAQYTSLDAKSFNGEVTVNLDITPGLEMDWRPNSRANISYNWVKNPRVEIVGGVWIDIKNLIEGKLNNSMNDLSAQATELINRQDLRTKVAEAYSRRSFPVTLPTGENLFFNIDPQAIEFSGIGFEANVLRLTAAIVAKVEVTATGIAEETLPLPNLSPVSSEQNQIDLKIPLRCSYKTLENTLKLQLAGNEFKETIEIGGLKGECSLTLRDFSIYASGQSLVIGVDVAANLPGKMFDTKGFVYLVGKPSVENGTIVRFDDLHYTQALDNEFWTAAGVLLQGKISEALKAKASYDAKSDMEKAKVKLDEAVKAKPITPTLRLVVENPQIGIGRVAVADSQIDIEALFKAAAAIRPITP